MGNEVLHGFDVIDRTRDQVPGALSVKEPMRQALDVAVNPAHQVVHHLVGGHVRETAVSVAA